MSHGGPCPHINGLFDIWKIIYFIDPRCWITTIINWIIDTILGAVFGGIKEAFFRLVLSVPVPAPASGSIAWSTPSGTTWATVYAQNKEFVLGGILFVALGAAIGMALGAVRAIPQNTKNTIYRRSILGGVFLAFNRPFLALYLEFSNVLVRWIAPSESCLRNLTFGLFGTSSSAIGIALAGLTLILLPALLFVVVAYVALEFLIHLMIYGLFMFAPVFIAGWAVAHGPLKPVGEKAKKGLHYFATVALANVPALIVWRSACELFGGANSLIEGLLCSSSSCSLPGLGIAVGMIEFVLGIMFLLGGLYITFKWTIAGQAVMEGIGKATKVAATQAAQGQTAAGLVASGANSRTAMELGKQVRAKTAEDYGFDPRNDSPVSNLDQALGYRAKSGMNRALDRAGVRNGLNSAIGRATGAIPVGGRREPFSFDPDGFSAGDPEAEDSVEVDEVTGERVGDRSSPVGDRETRGPDWDAAVEDPRTQEVLRDHDLLTEDPPATGLENVVSKSNSDFDVGGRQVTLPDESTRAVFDDSYATSSESGSPETFVEKIDRAADAVGRQLDDDDAERLAESNEEFDNYLTNKGTDEATADDVAQFARWRATDAYLEAKAEGVSDSAQKARIQEQVREDLKTVDEAVEKRTEGRETSADEALRKGMFGDEDPEDVADRLRGDERDADEGDGNGAG